MDPLDLATEFRPTDRSKHEVLIVDDDPASRYATSRLLHKAGFRVREAATGRDGLAAADDTISAMVLDVHLPDIDASGRPVRYGARTSRGDVLNFTDRVGDVLEEGDVITLTKNVTAG